jgi:hypothetical protein
MLSSGMLQRVVLVRTDVLEQCITSMIRVTIKARNISSVLWLLVTVKVVPDSPILVTLMMEVIHTSKTTILTRVTQHNIPEDNILHSHYCENFKSYTKIHVPITFLYTNKAG